MHPLKELRVQKLLRSQKLPEIIKICCCLKSTLLCLSTAIKISLQLKLLNCKNINSKPRHLNLQKNHTQTWLIFLSLSMMVWVWAPDPDKLSSWNTQILRIQCFFKLTISTKIWIERPQETKLESQELKLVLWTLTKWVDQLKLFTWWVSSHLSELLCTFSTRKWYLLLKVKSRRDKRNMSKERLQDKQKKSNE